jgi:hypothetical protein
MMKIIHNIIFEIIETFGYLIFDFFHELCVNQNGATICSIKYYANKHQMDNVIYNCTIIIKLLLFIKIIRWIL